MNTEPNYRNRSKNIWRNKWWKYAAKALVSLGKSPKTATVLFMPATDGLDVKAALRNGFLKNNLIGVDRSLSICKQNRKNKITMIHGDIIEVAAAWNPESFPDVILFDLCGGFSGSVSRLCSLIPSASIMNNSTVIGVNLMRGRDKWTEELRDSLKSLTAYKKINSEFYEFMTKHRGFFFFLRWCDTFTSRVLVPMGYKSLDECFEKMISHSMPMFKSYRSDGAKVIMDSVIFTWSQHAISRETLNEIKFKRIDGYSKKSALKVRNALAIKTMKNNRRVA